MTDAITIPDRQEHHRLTAEQIEKHCPERLRQIANEIKERLSKADKQTQQAQNHLIAVDKLLGEAKSLCDDGGFEKFRELLCPRLGKSQAYALLAIASGKKTVVDHRAEERDRKRRTRARQMAAAENSGTVPENSVPTQEPLLGTTTAQKRDAGTHQSAINPRDEALIGFSATVMDLIRRTTKQKPDRFAATSISPDDLARLGDYLLQLANLKKRRIAPTELACRAVSLPDAANDIAA